MGNGEKRNPRMITTEKRKEWSGFQRRVSRGAAEGTENLVRTLRWDDRVRKKKTSGEGLEAEAAEGREVRREGFEMRFKTEKWRRATALQIS
jgi:hypothetical protein